MSVSEFLRETYEININTAKLKRGFFGAFVGGFALLGATRAADAVVTNRAVVKAEHALAHLPDCESGLLPIRVREVKDTDGHPAQQFYCDGTFLYVSIPEVVAEDELGSIVVDWPKTRDYTEQVADQAIVLPGSSNERYQTTALTMAGARIGIGIALLTGRSRNQSN